MNCQLKMVQDTNKRLQEYNTSLQQYNSNLQADASKSGETISKLQKEKSTMMETMAALRECNNSMSSQLESSRVSTFKKYFLINYLLNFMCFHKESHGLFN